MYTCGCEFFRCIGRRASSCCIDFPSDSSQVESNSLAKKACSPDHKDSRRHDGLCTVCDKAAGTSKGWMTSVKAISSRRRPTIYSDAYHISYCWFAVPPSPSKIKNFCRRLPAARDLHITCPSRRFRPLGNTPFIEDYLHIFMSQYRASATRAKLHQVFYCASGRRVE